MVLLEIKQLTGYKTSNVDDLKNQANDLIKRVENSDEKVVIYFDGVIPTFRSCNRESNTDNLNDVERGGSLVDSSPFV